MKKICLLISMLSSTCYALSNTVPTEPCQTTWQEKLWGHAADEPRLYLGMWSAHSGSKERNGKNHLIGVSYHSINAGTLINSFGDRAYTIGMERYWITRPLYEELEYSLGYRIGLITGYKGHDVSGIRFLKESPIVPYVQLLAQLQWKYIGWEVSTPNPQVISTGFYIRFL